MIGRRVGAYRLDEEVGRGGMGVVYRAQRVDGEFEQTVAIKLIKRGMDTDQILKRFRRERQITAALNHPNIAYFLGGGSTEVTWMSVLPSSDAPCGMRVRILDVISIPWGVVTLSEAVTRGLPRDMPVPPDAYEAMIGRIVDALQPFDRRHAISTQVGARLVQMIGASGTVTTVAALHLGLKRYIRSSVDGTSVPREAIRRINAELSTRSIGALAELPCIGPERADLAPAGGAILEAVCRLWPVETVAVADRSLREGVLLDLMRQADREACAK